MSEAGAPPPLQWQALEAGTREALYALWHALSVESQNALAVWMAQGWQPSADDVADLLKLDRGEESPDAQVERIRRAFGARLG